MPWNLGPQDRKDGSGATAGYKGAASPLDAVVAGIRQATS